jgi:hypothetical protein
MIFNPDPGQGRRPEGDLKSVSPKKQRICAAFLLQIQNMLIKEIAI